MSKPILYLEGRTSVSGKASKMGAKAKPISMHGFVQSYLDETGYVPAVTPVIPYTVYRATLTQAGVAGPSATELETSTLTGTAPTWSYVSPGIYHLTSTGSFTDATKVEINIAGIQNFWNVSMSNSAINLFSATRLTADIIEVRTVHLDAVGGGSFTIPATLSDALTNALLFNTSFSVKVWS